MAIVVYKCDTCKREIEKIQNQRSVEVLNRCVITQGCRGHLYKVDFHPDFIRESLPDPVFGLTDWTQRKVLFDHIQSTERTRWRITHNLGTNPAVNVFVDRPLPDDPAYQEEIIPTDIVVVDKNTTELRFDRPWSGIAQLVARSSSPETLSPITTAATEDEIPVLLTNSGELTIATRSSVFPAARMALEITYSTITGGTFTSTHAFDSSPSINSPWVDYNRVVIGGKNYTVRSANIQIAEMVEGVVSSGATFYFDQTYVDADNEGSTPYTPKDGDVLVLLAGELGTTSDKKLSEFLDITTSTPTNNPFSLAHDGGELFSSSVNIETTYPPIQSAR